MFNTVELQRKHRSEMSEAEIRYAETLVHALTDIVAFDSTHLQQEMKADRLTVSDVKNTVKWGDVMEVNSRGRVVLRLMKGMRKGTTVVVDVKERKLVTAWYNRPTDKHATLRMSEYGWNVNIVELLGGLQ